MAKIKIIQQNETEGSWIFEVEVIESGSKTIHFVTVDKDYFDKCSERFSSAEELIEKSFEFLLERESKESILGEFNIEIIKSYFPEYEKEVL